MGQTRKPRDFYLNLRFLRALWRFFPLVYPRLEWAAFWSVAVLGFAILREFLAFPAKSVV